MYEAIGVVKPKILVLQDQSAVIGIYDSYGELTLRRQSHRRDVFSTPLNLRVLDCALSRPVLDAMADRFTRIRDLGAYRATGARLREVG